MGQYYLASVADSARTRVFSPQISLVLTKEGFSLVDKKGNVERPFSKAGENIYAPQYKDARIDYNCGLKLMEHSYIGNLFVQGVLSETKNNPARIKWVGDYSKDYKQINNSISGFNNKNILNPDDKSTKGGYIVNHDKRVYIDLKEYCDTLLNEYKVDEWKIHPLPLLCAVGNGEGGGDYFGINSIYVGLWSGDIIQWFPDGTDITKIEGIKHYRPFLVPFAENYE